MNLKYKIIYIIIFLLLVLSISLSFLNYMITLKSTQEYLENTSLPLSTDNIYSEIQTHLIEPNLVASMMAQDTFLKEWLLNDEESDTKIKAYLESIKTKYKMRSVFLASQKTQNYYLSRGFIEKMQEQNPTNAWYYKFKDGAAQHEINIDYNKNIDNSMFMFINHKILDENSLMIGATGVGFEISYINKMLKRFRENYKFRVFFVDREGKVIIYEHGLNRLENLEDDSYLKRYKDRLISRKTQTIKYKNSVAEEFLVHSKYIPELDLYLMVQAKISDFTGMVIKTFYLNLIASLLAVLIVIIIIAKMIHYHHLKMEALANNDALTNLPNRRVFNEKIKYLCRMSERKRLNIVVLFFDIDDFKKINDLLGHNIGDKVLVRIADIMRENLRESDLYARWGGEEFIVAFVNSSLEEAQIAAENLRVKIFRDQELILFTSYNVTASFGMTKVEKEDVLESILKRVDSSLYRAKEQGKNIIVLG